MVQNLEINLNKVTFIFNFFFYIFFFLTFRKFLCFIVLCNTTYVCTRTHICHVCTRVFNYKPLLGFLQTFSSVGDNVARGSGFGLARLQYFFFAKRAAL